MDKRRAIQIMTKAAQLYKEHLEDQKVLFLYGLPKEVNKQLQESNKILSSVHAMSSRDKRTLFPFGCVQSKTTWA